METTTPRVGHVTIGDGAVRITVPPFIEFRDTLTDGAVMDGTLTLVEGRYALTRLQLTGDVTAHTLRAVSVAAIASEAMYGVHRVVRVEGDRERTVPITELVDDDDAWVVADHLLAGVTGENPNVLIASDLRISVDAAAQRVARLRKRGLIPPATKKGAPR